MPDPASLTPVVGFVPFKSSRTNVPLAVLLPPSCNVRPPSSAKLVLLNAAPPCASVVPEPLCVPPENADAPVAVNVPVPATTPLDWLKPPTRLFPLSVSVELERFKCPLEKNPFAIVSVPPVC